MNPIVPILNIGSQIIDKLWPDKESSDKAKLELFQMIQRGELEDMANRTTIVKSETSSDNWLTASWRPILMLVFASLIVMRWFGFTATNITEAEYLKLWDIIELGIGGYVIGRSAEKVLPNLINVIKK